MKLSHEELKYLKDNIRFAFTVDAQDHNETPEDLVWAKALIAKLNNLIDGLIGEATQPEPQERMTYSHEELAGRIDPIWIKYAAPPQPAEPRQQPADSQEPHAPGEPSST